MHWIMHILPDDAESENSVSSCQDYRLQYGKASHWPDMHMWCGRTTWLMGSWPQEWQGHEVRLCSNCVPNEWQNLLVRYMAHVIDHESVSFLEYTSMTGDIDLTAAERVALERLEKTARSLL